MALGLFSKVCALLKESSHFENLFLIDGSTGQKERESIVNKLRARAGEDRPFVLLATASLLGEGFDMPELDTLFLAMPISFKGRLIQYAGRLHRFSEKKKSVRLYDYAEPGHPLTAQMFRKRSVAYREMGYSMEMIGSNQPDT